MEHFDNVKTAAGEIGGSVQSGDLILLKGSRAIGLEAIAKTIFAEPLAGRLSSRESRVMFYLLVKKFYFWLEAHHLGFSRVFLDVTFQSTAAVIVRPRW